MPVFAQMVVRFEWSSFSDAFADAAEVAMSNPLYLLGGLVIALFVGRLVFANRQI